jgi:hypothetical protein
MDRNDAGMLQSGQNVGLAPQSGLQISLRIGKFKHFHRDLSTEPGIFYEKDGAHSAST